MEYFCFLFFIIFFLLCQVRQVCQEKKKKNSDCKQSFSDCKQSDAERERQAGGERREGAGVRLLAYNPCKNGNFFESFRFCFSGCRHFVDSLKSPASAKYRRRTVYYFLVHADPIAFGSFRKIRSCRLKLRLYYFSSSGCRSFSRVMPPRL